MVKGQRTRIKPSSVLATNNAMNDQKRLKLWDLGGNSGWVYFVMSGALIKIGYASNVEQRVNDLRNMSSCPCNLLIAIRASRYFENYLHAIFDPCRHHAEWFFITDELAEFVDYLIMNSEVEGILPNPTWINGSPVTNSVDTGIKLYD